MNYFEIINKILLELNYSQVSNFSDLVTTEHKRLMDILNRLNKDICNLNDKFPFRQTMHRLALSADKVEYAIRFSGKVTKIIGNSIIYEFEPDYTKFYSSNIPINSYSIYGEKFLFPKTNDTLKIFYSTNNFVQDKNETLKADFEAETDKSIIPDNFVEKLFINGVAYNFKQNTSHPKYMHWKQEYDKAVSALLASCNKNVGSNVIINGGYREL